MNTTQLVFLLQQALGWQGDLEKTKVKLDILTDIDMLLMAEKSIRGRICHTNLLICES